MCAQQALPTGVIVCLVVGWVVSQPSRAFGWGGEHHLITRVAIEALTPEEQEFLAPEKEVLAGVYCGFPDMDWANQGEWGAGVGDPAGARLSDSRREWEISYYADWDPVLGTGYRYAHAPPPSCEASGVFLDKALEALEQGKYEDGVRFAGVMLHYIQDSGSFPHLQPFHVGISVRGWDQVHLGEYEPGLLSDDREQAGAQAARRVERLVAFTEERLAALLEPAEMKLAEVKERCAAEGSPAEVRELVSKIRQDRAEEWFAVTLDACLESARACADILHTLLQLAPKQMPTPEPNPAGENLVFNPSFEQDDGDGVPDGWVVGWLDREDREGRARWYRQGTHWGRHVNGGQHSVLILWAPEQGLQWRQTWPKAIRVQPGEKYECSGWVESKGGGGGAWIGLQVSDTNYQTIDTVKCEPISGDTPWHEVRLGATMPAGAKWLRVVLHSDMRDGAVWFDDLRVEKAAE